MFEQRWALEVIGRVLARLRSEFEGADRLQQFELLKPCLINDLLGTVQDALVSRKS